MARHYRVPPDITGPYATRVNGAWHSHRTKTGAWVAAWPARRLASTLVLACMYSGWEPVPQPSKRPGAVSGPSGPRSTLPRVELRVEPEDLELLRSATAAAFMPLATWVRIVAVAVAKKSAR